MNSVQTVSYTHLDVYKRQAPSGIYQRTRAFNFWNEGRQHMTEQEMKDLLQAGGIELADPVSYTHLDVYKRQLGYGL